MEAPFGAGMEAPMTVWNIEGFKGRSPTGFARQVTLSDVEMRALLERLVARHLTDDEVTDAILGKRRDLELRAEFRAERYTLIAAGSDHQYVAEIEWE
jgi:hypothetical protein